MAVAVATDGKPGGTPSPYGGLWQGQLLKHMVEGGGMSAVVVGERRRPVEMAARTRKKDRLFMILMFVIVRGEDCSKGGSSI